MKSNFDVIIIGAGSVGLPISFELSKKNFSVLVIDEKPSYGQGSNKKAIGGIRATHSNKEKIILCQRSIEIYSNWKQKYNYDIDWEQKGYSFVAYDSCQKNNLQEILKIQKSFGLNIDWLDKKQLLEVAPKINSNGLLGGTFSPEDGAASPLKVATSYYQLAKKNKANFIFNEKVINIEENSGIFTIKTNKDIYHSEILINAAGAGANEINQYFNLSFPVIPDSHEAAITEAVEKISLPMIVDMSPKKGSSSVYFHQLSGGQFILCLTPEPNIIGHDERETSDFLPLLAKRVISILPELKNVRVRRTWRGLYPNTPDGLPFLGETNSNFYQAIGMCGQGFMLGPSIGEVLARKINNEETQQDKLVLENLSPFRKFENKELLK